MLARGDVAPPLIGTTQSGAALDLAQLRGRPVVVYFYPKAGSPGCTRESKEFAGRYSELKARGIEVVGVSVDDVDSQRKFSDRCELPFPLVADRDREISRRYGVLGAFGLARRVTFVIGPSGRVESVVESFLPGAHVKEISRLLADEPRSTPPR